MNFSMGSIEEAKTAAQQADNVGGSYVEEPGAYIGKITKAHFQKFSSGSGAFKVESEVTDKNGEKRSLNFLIFTMKKDGKSTYEKDGKTHPLPGMNQITGGLMPVLNKKELPSVKNAKDEITYPSIEGMEIGFLVNIKITDGKKAGQVYKNPELVAFFDPKTNKTGSEILNNTDAKKKVKIEAGLKVIDETTKQQIKSDPFDDGEDDGLMNNPFEEENIEETEEVIEETTEEKTKAEIESEDDFWKEDSE